MVPKDEYQRRANECLRLAEQAPDEKERKTWRDLALCWLRLSDHAEAFRRESKAPAA